MYRHFEDELEDIKNSILKMSYHVIDQIQNSIKSLENKNNNIAYKVIDKDQIIDEMEIIIDDKCAEIILRHHPLAGDLRFVLGVLKLNNELERIADLAVDIAERSIEIHQYDFTKPYQDIFDLGDLVINMIKKSVQSFTERNYDMARTVISYDSKIDLLRDKISLEMIEKNIKVNPKNAQVFLSLILISRHLERIGDHCVNIAEDVIYMISGKVVKHHNCEY